MLQTYRDLAGMPLALKDEKFGSISDLYFDDRDWSVRYAVADIGAWYESRQGLVNAELIGRPDLDKRECPVALTKEQVMHAAPPEADPPVREQMRQGQSGVPLTAFFISHPGGVYSPVLAEAQIAALSEASGETGEGERDGDPHLRSMAEVLGYAISALDGEIGSVDDFLIDPECWQVRHVVVDTGNWLPGARVVLARDLLDAVSWSDRQISVRVHRQTVENSPKLERLSNVERDDLKDVGLYYGHPGL